MKPISKLIITMIIKIINMIKKIINQLPMRSLMSKIIKSMIILDLNAMMSNVQILIVNKESK